MGLLGGMTEHGFLFIANLAHTVLALQHLPNKLLQREDTNLMTGLNIMASATACCQGDEEFNKVWDAQRQLRCNKEFNRVWDAAASTPLRPNTPKQRLKAAANEDKYGFFQNH